MKLIPLHDNIFIERDKTEEKKSPGGIVLPEEAQLTPDTATVIAVGPGRLMESGIKIVPEVKEGDKILIGRFSGTEVNWGLEKRTVMPWGDVLGVVEDFDVVDVAPKEAEEKS